jgi:diguanylate cyclase (GGDEF)-like protein
VHPSGTDGLRSRLLQPTVRTGLLTLALVAAALTLCSVTDLGLAPPAGTKLDWWSIAVISLGVEMLAFDLEFRREVYTFTFSEIPLVLGLFLASPSHLIIGRLVGELVFLVGKSRQPFRKWSLNLASFTGECAIALTIAQWLSHHDLQIDRPSSWLSALLAVSAADLLSFVVVALAVRWHGGSLRFHSILSIGALTAPVNTSLALVAALLLTTQPWATLLLGGVAGFLALSYRSYTASTRRFESLSLLYDFTKLVTGGQKPDDALAAMLDRAKDLLGAERAEVWLVDGAEHHFALVVDDAGRTQRELPKGTQQSLDTWFGDSLEARIANIESRDQTSRSIATALAAESCIAAPLTAAGSVIGMVAVVNRLGDAKKFRAQDGPLFDSLAGQASVALDNGRLVARLHEQERQREHDAMHDPLTGLANRALFTTSISVALDSHSAVGVAVVDLDGFREINDTLGRESGDRVLVEVARRLCLAGDETVVVARLGADEFGLLVSESAGREHLEGVARHVRSALTVPMLVGGISVTIGSSAGLAVAPHDGRDATSLLARADIALQEAKAGDGLSFYNADTDLNTPRRLAMTHELREAIDSGEVWVAYQPKVRLADGVLTGFEALVRWAHPIHGPIGPDEFIPIAERTGTIRPLTEHVLSTAVAEAATWSRDGRDWNVAVNLSMRSLHDPELVDTVRRVLAEHALSPTRLTLEITESNVMNNPDRTIWVLTELSKVGVHLSVDDFGTGYSSLAYLQRLPVHEMKIDKSFIFSMTRDRASHAIVRSIVDLARNMGLSVVAEGVEDRETWEHLQRLGCAEAQGYYMAKPVPAADVPHVAALISDLQLAATPHHQLT